MTGTTGIGRAIARRFAAGGASVLACGIEVAANKELALDAEGERAELAGGTNATSPRREAVQDVGGEGCAKNLAGSTSS